MKMTNSKLVSAAIAASLTLLAASGANAARSGFGCLLAHAPLDTHRVTTICAARTAEAKARLRAANCDPAVMSDQAMRDLCKALMGAASASRAGA
jgi:hypothetical protein